MKTDFLNKLKEKLVEYKACNKDIDEILSDYDQLYDDALNSGKTEEEILRVLGSPESIIYDLRDTLQTKKERNIKNKIIAVMPFLSLIIFFILGFYKDLWHPGWLVFLSIPVSALLLQTRLKEGIISLMPFISVIAFLILGWGWGLWNVGWLVFLSIPIVAILLKTPIKKVPVAISPFVAVITFFILGFFYNLWDPAWLIFFIIPMIGILYSKNIVKIIIFELAFIIAIGFYLYTGYIGSSLIHGRFVMFLLPLAVGLLYGDIKFMYGDFKGPQKKKAITMFLISLIALAIFIALGVFLDGWQWAWQVFLFIPMAAILLFDRFRLTAIMPFIAVILFFSLGYFFHLFNISWLAFLLIPITAIIENA